MVGGGMECVAFSNMQFAGFPEARLLAGVFEDAHLACDGKDMGRSAEVVSDVAFDVLGFEAQKHIGAFVGMMLSESVSTTNPAVWLAARHAVQCASRLVVMPECRLAVNGCETRDYVMNVALHIGALCEAADPHAFALMQAGGSTDMASPVFHDLMEGRSALWMLHSDVLGRASASAIGLNWDGLVTGYSRSLAMQIVDLAVDSDGGFARQMSDQLSKVGVSYGRLSADAAKHARAAGHLASKDVRKALLVLGSDADVGEDDGTGYCGVFGVDPVVCVGF